MIGETFDPKAWNCFKQEQVISPNSLEHYCRDDDNYLVIVRTDDNYVITGISDDGGCACKQCRESY